MRWWIILFAFFLPVIVFAQSNISGNVTRADTRSAVTRASVFLSNSSFGTATAEDGSFNLTNVRPGQYTLVITSVGFEDYMQTILVGKDPINLTISLLPKVMELKGVVISTKADWKKNYELFKKDFIGVSENSKQCKVVNPHVLDFIYSRSKQTLEASSDEFLIVENHALGYRVKFLLKEFKSDKIAGLISWEGQALFEELPGTVSQKQNWKLKREQAYYGSGMHFYRSLYTNQLNERGFVIRRLIRKPNPERPQELFLQQKIKKFRETNRDSLTYWTAKYNLPKYKETLIRDPMMAEQICAKTDQPGLYIISFADCLYVVYTKKHEDTDFKDVYRALDMENFETSVVTLFTPYAVFDMNGIIVSQPSPLYEGTWSKAKLAELLPVDYVTE